jgi:hypothetical protein
MKKTWLAVAVAMTAGTMLPACVWAQGPGGAGGGRMGGRRNDPKFRLGGLMRGIGELEDGRKRSQEPLYEVECRPDHQAKERVGQNVGAKPALRWRRRWPYGWPRWRWAHGWSWRTWRQSAECGANAADAPADAADAGLFQDLQPLLSADQVQGIQHYARPNAARPEAALSGAASVDCAVGQESQIAEQDY